MNERKEKLRKMNGKYIDIWIDCAGEFDLPLLEMEYTNDQFLMSEIDLGLWFLSTLDCAWKMKKFKNANEITFILKTTRDQRYILDRKTVYLDKILDMF